MKIYYGTLIDAIDAIDITQICFEQLRRNDIIEIPSGDINRSYYFTDPLVGTHKKIFIINNSINEYDETLKIYINILTNEIKTISETEINNKLTTIQSKLKINHGTFTDELPEQKMVVRYLTGNEKVLEIGGNIGRNSLIIASILFNNNNMVTLECDKDIATQLTENRNLNGLQFHIECAALSKRKLIQHGWDTIPSDILLPGYTWVNTVTYDELNAKYNIDFDTLVLDCEGAFYYILTDMPEILNGINLIIMENDYTNIIHKNYIDDVLTRNGFKRDYVESGGWNPCYDFFFEVWRKNTYI